MIYHNRMLPLCGKGGMEPKPPLAHKAALAITSCLEVFKFSVLLRFFFIYFIYLFIYFLMTKYVIKFYVYFCLCIIGGVNRYLTGAGMNYESAVRALIAFEQLIASYCFCII